LASATGSTSSPRGDRTYVKRSVPGLGAAADITSSHPSAKQAFGLLRRIVDPVSEVMRARALSEVERRVGRALDQLEAHRPAVENVNAISIEHLPAPGSQTSIGQSRTAHHVTPTRRRSLHRRREVVDP
jgi:hypothetical protein